MWTHLNLLVFVLFNAHRCVRCETEKNNDGDFSNNITTRELIPLEAPKNLTLINFDEKEAIIRWESVKPESVRGTFRGYIVRIWNHAFSQVYAIPPEVTKTAVQFFPYSKNFITVAVRNDKYVGPRSEAVSFDAPQTEPGMPFLFEQNQLGSHSVLLRWNKPTHANGVLLGYNIYCSEVFDFGINEKTTVTYFVQGADNFQAKLTGLKEGTKYQIEIGAVNCAGESEHNTLEVEVEPHIPEQPSVPSFKYKINYNDTDPKDHFKWECYKPRYPYVPQTSINFDNFDDDFYVFNDTHGKIVTPKPTPVPQGIEMVTAHDPCLVKTLITWIPDVDNHPGDHFYVKYRIRGEKEFHKTIPELEEDFFILENFNRCRSYEISVVAVDGDYQSESEVNVTPAVMFMYKRH